jgi:hypothetical protein
VRETHTSWSEQCWPVKHVFGLDLKLQVGLTQWKTILADAKLAKALVAKSVALMVMGPGQGKR